LEALLSSRPSSNGRRIMQSDRRPVKLISKINSGLSFDLSIGFEKTAVVPLF
jgi:hypothetical protein